MPSSRLFSTTTASRVCGGSSSREWRRWRCPSCRALQLEQDPIHKHKDVLAHTIAVTNKTRPEIVIRLAALFHDIGKPATRSFDHGGVTFRHHEAVGAKITKKTAAGVGLRPVGGQAMSPNSCGSRGGSRDTPTGGVTPRSAGTPATPVICSATSTSWFAATVRREIGPRKPGLMAHIDELEQRIVDLARADAKAKERPQMDGNAVMELPRPRRRAAGRSSADPPPRDQADRR